ncbi:MAG: LysM peptidoglycan-binding domain-containing protein [Candidatus Limnocylindrales bacterium]
MTSRPEISAARRVLRLALGLASVAVLATVTLACVPPSVRRPGATDGSASAGTASATPTATPTPVAAASGSSSRPSFLRPTPTPQPTFLAYVVKAGDTLTSIAREQRTTPRSIAFWNREAHPSLDPDAPAYAPNRIEVGWVLLLVPDLEADPEDFS